MYNIKYHKDVLFQTNYTKNVISRNNYNYKC